MKIKDLEERINILSLIEKDYNVTKTGNTYRVNPCPICGSKDHFTIYPETNSYSSFSECCNGGSVYKYLQEVKNMSESAAREELFILSGIQENEININYNEKKDCSNQPTKSVNEQSSIKDYTSIINELYNKQTEKDRFYFKQRGISDEVIEKYKLCIGKIDSFDSRAILPVWEDDKVIYYNARSLEENPKIKYMKPKGTSYFFNGRYLKKLKENETIIITEGEFDTLSLESMGFKSIALSGTQNIENIIKEIQKSNNYEKVTFITAFDNDDPGIKAAKKTNLQNLSIPKEYKDINEWALSDKKIKENITNQIINLKNKEKQPHSLYNYLREGFIGDIESYKGFKDRKTGFRYLDEMTSLYPGLYVIGGISGLGKTTFIHQLSDQVAETGEHILFFSLEMGKLELLTKSISRQSVLNDGELDLDSGVTALQIRLDDISEDKKWNVKRAIKDYEDNSKRFNIIEGNFSTDVLGVRNYVETYIQKNKVKPLVIVDYLQIIPGSINDRSDKERIDNAVVELKRISRDFNITVIVVSSLNRGNYMTPIAFESFKESGGIEYTSDVVWGLQLQALNDDKFLKAKTITERRKIINQAMKENPRRVELVCLKNRNGVSSYNCKFAYYPQFDLFLDEKPYSISIEEMDEDISLMTKGSRL